MIPGHSPQDKQVIFVFVFLFLILHVLYGSSYCILDHVIDHKQNILSVIQRNHVTKNISYIYRIHLMYGKVWIMCQGILGLCPHVPFTDANNLCAWSASWHNCLILHWWPRINWMDHFVPLLWASEFYL